MAALKPGHLKFWIPVIEILRGLGGSGQASEVADKVIEYLDISESEQNENLQSGGSKIYNQISWARFLLVKLGYLDASQRSVWTLTEKGYKADLDEARFHEELKELKRQKRLKRKNEKQPEYVSEEQVIDAETESENNSNGYREELLEILKTLPPEGFERICQRLLRESGFEQVNVTGRSGDGGIDGNGIIQVNPFVSFTVLFQCKRYRNTISPSIIRDFRGAMMGRADKGIILTTGTYSIEAKKEARREGVPPIELVDGEKLIDMFELLEFGLKPRKTYDVDLNFFNEFGRPKS